MAKNDRMSPRSRRSIETTAKGISDIMDTLYKSTYMATPTQSRELKDLNDQINAHIDNIVSNNKNAVGTTSVSTLYARVDDANKATANGKVIDSLEGLFDNGLMGTDLYEVFSANRFLRELDMEIDTVCGYMPELDDALAVQKDCVLSADHFSKEFLNVTHPGYSVDDELFNERVKDIKRKYGLATLVEDIYENTSKYGEQFVYNVPYATAIGRLLATKPDTTLLGPPNRNLNEGADVRENERFVFSIKSESFTITNVESGDCAFSESAVLLEQSRSKHEEGKIIASPILGKDQTFDIAIEICTSNVIESVVRAHEKAQSILNSNSAKSMAHIHETSSKKDIKAAGNIDLGPKEEDKRIIQANDGLVVGKKAEPVKVTATGCVIKRLERDHVMPIYIDDLCMGYYYFEVKAIDKTENMAGFRNLMGDPLTNLSGGQSTTALNAVDQSKQDNVIRYIAGQLSKFIDKKFVNNNQDLSKEIYMILKANELFNTPSVDLLKVTFIPPEDMIHVYFRMDDKIHRGISDLAKSLFPAKMYCSLYITDSLAHLTRGQDKRVYYVKQTVDTNISQTLLNTIAQIKQSNFGIRQFQNINSVLNITGRFNDYVIPTNASGDPPVQFEIMPGQDINSPTELMESLKKAAVDATGIPFEMIQTRNSVDYAMQLTMSSSKTLRWCYKRQELYQEFLSRLVTNIYNYEYDETIELKVTLPPPSFINVTNTNQLVDNTRTYVTSIAEIELADSQDDALKNRFISALFNHYMGTHIDVSAHKDILTKCKMELKTDNNESHSNDAGESDY